MLRSRLLSKAGRFRESSQSWLAVADREPLLKSYGRGEAARALLDAGDVQAVLDAIPQLPGTPPTDILLRAAAAARTAGILDRAAALYQRARNGAGRSVTGDEAALGFIATLEQAGNPREALDAARELQLTFRQLSAYDAADATARRLSAQLNGAEPLEEQDYETISERLAGIAAFRRAVDVLREWRTKFPDSPRTNRIQLAIIQDLYQLRANSEARAEAEAFLKTPPKDADAASASRTLVSLDAREGKTPDVERRAMAFVRDEVPGATLEQRQAVTRLLAEYLLAVGRAEAALPLFEQLYRMTISRNERIDIMWRTAVAALRVGDRTKAIAQLREARRLRLDSETDRATKFWLAFALDGNGARTEARTLWTSLVERYPFSYYGVRAMALASLSLPAPTLTFPMLMLNEEVTRHADYRTAALLSGAGLLPEAAYYARRLSGTFRRDGAAALMAARASAAAGDSSSTSTLMSSFFGDFLERPATGLPEDFWPLAYPRAFWEEVAPAAARHHVDPLLMIALARQESHFQRAIKSPVGAIGLFQIMPTTAAELDSAFQVDKADDQLVKPDVAAELAARLIESLSARFQTALAPTVASYNADKERVQVWWDAAKGLPEELFVDSIPYRETRTYVRQVLANYAMYLRFAAPRPSPQK